MYVYLGDTVASPALLSLPPTWAKITFGVGLGNFLVYVYPSLDNLRRGSFSGCRAGALYSHTAAKLVFVRFFRHTRHIYSHTALGWAVWVLLCFAAVTVACILAIAVPIFSDLIGIAAALFAAWYTYGLAGFFWLHDAYHLDGGRRGLARRWVGTSIAILTIIAGGFICVAGAYVSIKVGVCVDSLGWLVLRWIWCS